MNKHFINLFFCLFCLFIAVSSCKNDDEDPIGPLNFSNTPNPYYSYIASEGDTVVITWRENVFNKFKFETANWNYNGKSQSNTISPYTEMETSISGDTISGEWFTTIPVPSMYTIDNRKYSGIKLVLSANNTGERRCLRITPSVSGVPVEIFQEFEEQTPKLPVFKYFDGAEFDSLFVSSTWTVNGIYDVDKNGNLGKNILTTIDGLGSLTIDPAENGAVRFRHQPTDPNQTETVTDAAYTFQTANWLTFDKTVAPCPQTLKVLEITDKQMRCLGEVYDKAQSPNAIKGLYVFKRQVKE